MREDILIALNEREAIKQDRAAELLRELENRRLSVCRLRPGKELAELILLRNPRAAVLDYLIGDFGTVMEVLHTLAEHKSETRCIVWTDEPSLFVAVEAMKLGAVDYIDISSPNSVERVVHAVTSCLVGSSASESAIQKTGGGENLIYLAPSAQKSLSAATAAAQREQEITVLAGPAGAGRSALARLIHTTRSFAGALIEIDLDLSTTMPEAIFGRSGQFGKHCLLSHGATLVIDHAEADDGSLLESAAKYAKRSARNDEAAPMLIVGTSEPGTARAWRRMADAKIIEIPGLEERPEDFLPLVQQIYAHARRWWKSDSPLPSHEFIRNLQLCPWPGNIAELRSSLLDAISSGPSARLSADPDNEEALFKRVLAAKDLWSRYTITAGYTPVPLAGRRALASVCGNFRVAAAMLGCSVAALRASLGFNEIESESAPEEQR